MSADMQATAMGRPRGWRRVARWIGRGLIALLGLLLLAVVAGAIYEALSRRAAARDFPAPGQRVDVGGRMMHIDCRGTGRPTVILEAGLGTGGAADWALVHDRIAAVTRTCAYDRAGIMHSDPKDGAQDANAVARDLHATLRAAGISGPLVLAGHSIGGPYVRAYTGLYGGDVAGLVLVDSSHPDQVARFARVIESDTHPGQMAGTVRIASALSWTGAVRLLLGGERLPHMPRAAGDAVAAHVDRSVKGVAAELAGFDRTMDQARAVKSLSDRPLVVLTAMQPLGPAQLEQLGMAPADGARMKQVWRTLNAELTALSTRGEQRLFPDAGHYIQLDRPDAVVTAVRDVVGAVRAQHSMEKDR